MLSSAQVTVPVQGRARGQMAQASTTTGATTAGATTAGATITTASGATVSNRPRKTCAQVGESSLVNVRWEGRGFRIEMGQKGEARYPMYLTDPV